MKEILKFAVLAAMLLGLPLAGVLVAQLPASRYFEFPPRTLYIEHAPFSWIAFISYSLFILAALGPFFVSALRNRSQVHPKTPPANRFPWWGWCGVLLGLFSWILAWNRFPWFSKWQAHTFTPLWIAYILTVNGFTQLGLVEMTRKRTRESLAHVLCETCPTCHGRGELKTAQTICFEILRGIVREAKQFNAREFRILASQSVIDMFLEEESQSLAQLGDFIGKPISLQVETVYTQEQYDIVLI